MAIVDTRNGTSFPLRSRAQSWSSFVTSCVRKTCTTPRSRRSKTPLRRRPGRWRNARTSDGTYNDLTCPRMGSAGMRFGRNVPLSETFPDTANLMTPSPRRVSLELLTRTTFQPATILNVIAAAWIQFMVHDWFMHKKGAWTHTHDIPVAMATPGTSGRCACRRRRRIRQRFQVQRGRQPTSTRTPTGGTARRCMAAAPPARRLSAPDATAKCSSAPAGGSGWIRSRATRSPASPRTAGSV